MWENKQEITSLLWHSFYFKIMVQIQNKNRTRSGMYSIKTSCKEMNKTLISTKPAPTNDKTVGIWCIMATWKKTGHYSSIFRFSCAFLSVEHTKWFVWLKKFLEDMLLISVHQKIRNSNKNRATRYWIHSNLILRLKIFPYQNNLRIHHSKGCIFLCLRKISFWLKNSGGFSPLPASLSPFN